MTAPTKMTDHSDSPGRNARGYRAMQGKEPRARHAAPSVRCVFAIAVAVSAAVTLALCAAAFVFARQTPCVVAPSSIPLASIVAEGADRVASTAADAIPPERSDCEKLSSELGIIEDFRPEFVHGEKTAEHQKYIVLHDTEGEGDPQSVVDFWAGNGNLVAAHFVVGKDGTIVQCVPLDAIAHHAGYGDTGHNEHYGVSDESRDDMLGSVPIGEWAADYGMNSHSVGIELVHVGGSGDYPQAQLEALDALVAYIDAYYGFESEIIDHKAWRSGNSDTSPEFAAYLDNYKDHRTHADQAAGR